MYIKRLSIIRDKKRFSLNSIVNKYICVVVLFALSILRSIHFTC